MRRVVARFLICTASCTLASTTLLTACGSGDKATAPTPVSLDSISPSKGTVGTEVRISGRGFTSASQVLFGTLASTNVQLQNGVLFATAPSGLTAGSAYDVKVANGGTSATLTSAFQAVAPSVSRVNGATLPTGLAGMTVLIEGAAFGDARHGKVLFTNTGGSPIQATIADSVNDWTDSFIVTTVPQGVTSTSQITVQTATGTSAGVTFTLISGASFSPSTIAWTATTALPVALQGLGAAFVPAVTAAQPRMEASS